VLFRRLPADLPALRDYEGAVGHGGTLPGYTTLVLMSRDRSRVVVAAANSHSLPVSRAVRSVARELL